MTNHPLQRLSGVLEVHLHHNLAQRRWRRLCRRCHRWRSSWRPKLLHVCTLCSEELRSPRCSVSADYVLKNYALPDAPCLQTMFWRTTHSQMLRVCRLCSEELRTPRCSMAPTDVGRRPPGLQKKRTNNGAESCHRHLNSMFYASHPSIHDFQAVTM